MKLSPYLSLGVERKEESNKVHTWMWEVLHWFLHRKRWGFQQEPWRKPSFCWNYRSAHCLRHPMQRIYQRWMCILKYNETLTCINCCSLTRWILHLVNNFIVHMLTFYPKNHEKVLKQKWLIERPTTQLARKLHNLTDRNITGYRHQVLLNLR